ncbi:hypothetical protein EVAR_57599_1 [Eumeta japonica]|uniref:Uncharacterized protein n=1 Tax=Eumeta variegata TaxID=151549 RepID=A0A4C1XYN1_EUMVA|nr:hypothetical protein EVAR_57599_1 [Eumeta japonica]
MPSVTKKFQGPARRPMPEGVDVGRGRLYRRGKILKAAPARRIKKFANTIESPVRSRNSTTCIFWSYIKLYVLTPRRAVATLTAVVIGAMSMSATDGLIMLYDARRE